MLLSSLILLFATLLGGGLFFAFGKRGIQNLDLVLSFGGAFVIGMCFLHLLPEAFSQSSVAGEFVLVGFLLQGGLEFFSQGIEHGHLHAHEHDEHCQRPFQWGRLPFAALFSLALHAALESMPILHHDYHEGHVHGPLHMDAIDWGLITGLVLHKVPVAIVLMAMMIERHVPKLWAWGILVIFGLSPLVGMASFESIVESSDLDQSSQMLGVAQALVVGILLHIGTTIIFEAGDGHAFNRRKFAAILMGTCISLLAFS